MRVKSKARKLATVVLSTLAATCAIPLLVAGDLHEKEAQAGDSLAQRLPRLTRMRDAVTHASGPFAYAALRKVWREWAE